MKSYEETLKKYRQLYQEILNLGVPEEKLELLIELKYDLDELNRSFWIWKFKAYRKGSL